ncbi:agmatine deiminase family protein [Aestuariibacter sp. A3R04]|uniref:agmatine deiminase family protein n=1 Tax=Aestuariibacter sp. A3R04 TaxID=2841571 RepID=UPI001C08BFD4|nr:agmatine deiminase family protein [Aestuariibacter sp. A3R04]MBU3023579.1 agmatine deiminase family protein [Aestuariibacter sp. A3R04]
MTNSVSTLVPEWEAVDAVILAWPHDATDWAPWLEDTRQTYLSVIKAVNAADAGVILLCRPDDIADVQARLDGTAKVLIVGAKYNDTWARDYAFLTCRDAHDAQAIGQPVEFTFNGWGEKFNALRDNDVNTQYLASLCQLPIQSSHIVAEGGALEIDGNGHLLSTAQCLLNPKRNDDMSLNDYREAFTSILGCSTFTVFQHGHLEGDDTDGHIDTLVRFTPDSGLVIQAADNRPDDEHFSGLTALCDECAAALPEHKQFRLPLPSMFNDDGDRLPASYANFLICNRSVLFPVYGQEEDELALSVAKQAFPGHQIVSVDCAPLVRQFGSLHCISMQVPTNTLRNDVLTQLKQGVTVYG